MIKVLIADDSTLTRAILREILSQGAGVEVVGEACDGREAVEETTRLRPDLVIMDVMMPVMDGLSATMEIMATCPTPILVLSANVDPSDSRSAFNAIKHGALDVMEKPQGVLTEAFGEFSEQLIARVRVLSRVRVIHHFRKERSVLASELPRKATTGRRDIIAIGASTGGPKAVMRLLKELPGDLGAPILIVQHIAQGFAGGFADWLDRESSVKVRLAREGEGLREGVALVAPNDVHLTIEGGTVHLLEAPPLNCCRPAVDALFSSLAMDGLASRVVAVLLTGMGRDGADGMAKLAGAGAFNIAQDESSSAVFGMPKAAIELGAVNKVLPLAEIPDAVLSLLKS